MAVDPRNLAQKMLGGVIHNDAQNNLIRTRFS
jgi:hypothetical protein